MKKLYFVILMVILPSLIFAQSKTNPNFNQNFSKATTKILDVKATGDTLMYCDGYYIQVNPTDQANFVWNMEDLDGLTVNATMSSAGWNSGWMSIYDNTSAGCTPDTCWWFGATSWFDTPGQADNWIEFGPLTIPAAGATLSWQHRIPDPAYSDGYKVWASTAGMTAADFLVGTNLFTRTDNQAPTAPDTNWTTKTAILGAFAGQQVYIGLQHDANDMFILYLDNFLVTEQPNAGINEEASNGIKLGQNQPNPANGMTTIQYEINNAGNVSLELYDMTGRQVLFVDEGKQAAGKHNILIDSEKLNEGAYYYSLKVNDTRLTKKMIITK